MLLPREKTMAMVEGIALAHCVTLEDIFSDKRSRLIKTARFRCYLALRNKGMSLPQIGEFMGRDHTTIRNGLIQLRNYDK